MNYIIRFILKPLSLVPAILVLATIFSFSSQTSDESSNVSNGVSGKIVAFADKALDLQLTTAQTQRVVNKIEHPIRKIAHFSEYFLLAVCIAFPLHIYGLRGFGIIIIGIILCFGFASFDEIHQLFVNGRSGQLRDVFIDSCGALSGLILAKLAAYIIRKCIFEPLKSTK